MLYLEIKLTRKGPVQLLVADQNRKLRLYKGINLQSEHALVRHARGITPIAERHQYISHPALKWKGTLPYSNKTMRVMCCACQPSWAAATAANVRTCYDALSTVAAGHSLGHLPVLGGEKRRWAAGAILRCVAAQLSHAIVFYLLNAIVRVLATPLLPTPCPRALAFTDSFSRCVRSTPRLQGRGAGSDTS